MTIVNLLILAALLGASALVSAVESAVTALSPLRMKRLAFMRPELAPSFQEWLDHPHRFLTVLMSANNLFNTALSSFIAWLSVPWNDLWPGHSVGLAVWFGTFLILLVGGEIVPKLIGRTYRERISAATLPVLGGAARHLSWLWRPVDWVLRQWPGRAGGARSHPLSETTVEELHHVLTESHSEGHLTGESVDMFRRVLALPEKTAARIAQPVGAMDTLRLEILEENGGVELFLDLLAETGRTRVPVTRAGAVVGYVNVRDVLPALAADAESPPPVRPLRRIPGERRVFDLLEEFRRSGDPIALLVDGDGRPTGLVTLEDVMEEIVGEILDEYDVEEGRLA
jgi:putative hemolysin